MRSSVYTHGHDLYENEDDVDLSLRLLAQLNGTLPGPPPTYSNTSSALALTPSTHDERFHASLQLSSLVTYLRSRTALSTSSSRLHCALSSLDFVETQITQFTLEDLRLSDVHRPLQAALTAVEQKEAAAEGVALEANQALKVHARFLDGPEGLARMRDPVASRTFKEERARWMEACDMAGKVVWELEMEKSELGQQVGGGRVKMVRMTEQRNVRSRERRRLMLLIEEVQGEVNEMEERVLGEVLQLVILSKRV